MPALIRVENPSKEFRRVRRQEGLLGGAVVAWAAPLVGVVWFLAAYRFWRWQPRAYQSSGA